MGNILSHNNICNMRAIIMGISIIMIMLFHHGSYLPGINVIVNISAIGYWGVEIFLFLSGYGIAMSLKKNSKKQYFKNRFVRIIPIVGIIELLSFIVENTTNWDILPDSIIVYVGGIHIWYIKAILVYYLLAPCFDKVLDKWGTYFLFVLMFFYLFTLPVPRDVLLPWRIFTRMPVFVMGMMMYKNIFVIKDSYIVVGAVVALLTWYLQINNYICIVKDNQISSFLLLFSILFLMWLFILISEGIVCLGLGKVIAWLGHYSLELYLIHESVFKIVGLQKFPIENVILFIMSIIISCGIAFLVRKLYECIIHFFENVSFAWRIGEYK